MNIPVTFSGGPDDGRKGFLWGKWRENRRVLGEATWDAKAKQWRAPIYKVDGRTLVFTGEWKELGAYYHDAIGLDNGL